MDVGHCKKGHVAEDAAGSPVVVVVEVRAFSLSHHAHRQLLLFCFAIQEGSNIKLGGIVGRSPRASLLSVHPHIVSIEHAVESQYHSVALPPFWHGECCLIVSCQWRSMIVMWLAETVSLPAARHRNGAPGTVDWRNSQVGGDAFHYFQVPRPVETFLHRGVGHRPHSAEGVGYSSPSTKGCQDQAQGNNSSSHTKAFCKSNLFSAK